MKLLSRKHTEAALLYEFLYIILHRHVTGEVPYESLPMEGISGDQVVGGTMSGQISGNPTIIHGVIGNALEFGRGSAYGSFVDLGEQSNSWLGNPDLCQQGFTLSFWVMFPRLDRQVVSKCFFFLSEKSFC